MEKFAPIEKIIGKIYWIRGEKIMLDSDLAALYGVETKALKRAVRRNINRFPEDFMFELSIEELAYLRCQIGTSSWGGTRYKPMAFSEQGVAMLSSVLSSERAIEVNISIMRVFVQLRKLVASQKQLSEELSALEQKFEGHDEQIQVIFKAIKLLMAPPEKPRKKIGFIVKEKQRSYGRLKSKPPGRNN